MLDTSKSSTNSHSKSKPDLKKMLKEDEILAAFFGFVAKAGYREKALDLLKKRLETL